LSRIAILLPDLRGGGAERVNLTLAREFLARGHAVDFVLMRAEGELIGLVPEGARVIDLQAPRVRDLIGPLVRYLRRSRPDAVLAAMWPLTSVAVLARALARFPVRLVLSEHTTLSRHYSGRGALHRLVLRASLALTCPLANARVTVSGGVAEDMARLGGLRRDHAAIIHNPVPPALPGPVPDSVEALWRSPRGHRILAVGSFKAEKNLSLLIRAFAHIADLMDARLMLLGEGSLRPDLEALARKVGVADRVAMPGFAADPGPYYQSADLFVLSSDYEGLPTVLIEALGHGLPVVSTDCPSGPAEILENGRYGRLVPVGDAAALATAMAEALVTDHDRDALRRRAADFAPEKAADRYLALLFPDLLPHDGAERATG
jgi:glycosyltransferase involved in cell wall biosynthesis